MMSNWKEPVVSKIRICLICKRMEVLYIFTNTDLLHLCDLIYMWPLTQEEEDKGRIAKLHDLNLANKQTITMIRNQVDFLTRQVVLGQQEAKTMQVSKVEYLKN